MKFERPGSFDPVAVLEEIRSNINNIRAKQDNQHKRSKIGRGNRTRDLGNALKQLKLQAPCILNTHVNITNVTEQKYGNRKL